MAASILPNPEDLDRLIESYVLATGLPAGCGIFSFAGERILPLDLTRFPRICRISWTSTWGQERCQADCRQILSRVESGGSRHPISYACHLGLTICAAPIFREATPIGAVVGGQVWSEYPSPGRRVDLIRKSRSLQVDECEMERALDEVRVVPLRQIEGATGLLQAIVNYLVSTSLAKERSEREVELERMLYETELGLLQSKINPHFLFNALNTVMWLASLEKANETVKIVCALADLLRYNLKQLGQLVPLEQEVEQIKGYLLIQMARFGDRLTFVVDVEPTVAATPVPVLILQPLVENAVIHGLELKEGRGTLVITARRGDCGVVVMVKDDGVGMSAEKVNRIRELATKGGSSPKVAGLGLVNVARSLYHHYGGGAIMDVASNAGSGTTVRLVIPEQGIRVEPRLLSAAQSSVRRAGHSSALGMGGG